MVYSVNVVLEEINKEMREHEQMLREAGEENVGKMRIRNYTTEKEYAEEHCRSLIAEEKIWCGQMTCSKPCVSFGDQCSNITRSAFCVKGDTCHSGFRLLILPCWVLQLMRVIKPCCQTTNPDGKLQREDLKICDMRDEARKAVRRAQLPVLPYIFRLVWPFIMIVSLVLFFAFNIRQLFVNLEVSIAAAVINSLFIIMWITFTSLNFTRYKPCDGERNTVKRESNLLSYFEMEQTQQYLSELSMYPQLGTSFALLSTFNGFAIVPFVVCCLNLLVVFSLRIYTVVKIKNFVKLYYRRLLFSFIGNYVAFFTLSAALLAASITQASLVIQFSIAFLILISTPWNQLMFYISYLYEISLQSALTLLSANVSKEAGSPLIISNNVSKLTNFDSFHKNMYAISAPCYGILLYVWPYPSFIVLLVAGILSDDDQTAFIAVCVYILVFLVVNCKAFLLTSAVHLVLFTIIGIIGGVIMLAGAVGFAIYAPIIIIVAVIIVILVLGSLKQNAVEQE